MIMEFLFRKCDNLWLTKIHKQTNSLIETFVDCNDSFIRN